MSAVTSAYAWQHSPYKGSRFLIHLALGDLANDAHDYELWISTKNLAAKARVSRSLVCEVLSEMVCDCRIYLVESGQKAGKPSRYIFLMPNDAEREHVDRGGGSEELCKQILDRQLGRIGGVAVVDTPAHVAGTGCPRGGHELEIELEEELNNTADAEIQPSLIAEEVPGEQPRKVSEEQAREILATEFATLWEQYPRKGERSPAFVQYRKRRQDGASAEDLLRAVQGYAQAMAAEGRPVDKIKHGGTFLGPSGVWHDYLDREPEPDEETRMERMEREQGIDW